MAKWIDLCTMECKVMERSYTAEWMESLLSLNEKKDFWSMEGNDTRQKERQRTELLIGIERHRLPELQKHKVKSTKTTFVE